MTLEMRSSCEVCGQTLCDDGEAWICSYECTYCTLCCERLEAACPNCGGEIVRRPRRRSEPASRPR